MNHIFGPVPSRRLGRSLGVDLVPFKTCSYDCIYCQLGRTTCKTIQRKEWFPLDEIVKELQAKLGTNPDFITLSGSGEPTLYSHTGELIDRIKGMTDVPIAVLTNGSLLWNSDVREQLLSADLVVPSLDAGDENMFQAVNRPDKSVAFDVMLDGLIEFRRVFSGQYWLEVFLMAGHNAIDGEVLKLVDCVRRIKPDRVQLNTVTRPPAEDYANVVCRERLEKIAGMFDPQAEVIADFRDVHKNQEFTVVRQNVLELLTRRPCSIGDIAGGLGIHRNEVVKFVEELLAENRIEKSTVGEKIYYKAIGL